jgi:hypothetical protein
MLSTNTINDSLVKMGLNEFEYSVTQQDNTGDFLEVFSPELNFSLVKKIILETKSFYTCVDDIGPDYVKLIMKDYIDGIVFYYHLRFVSGGAFGTKIAIGTKRIDYYNDNGDYLPFITFEMMSQYISAYESTQE